MKPMEKYKIQKENTAVLLMELQKTARATRYVKAALDCKGVEYMGRGRERIT